ncbi:MAG TPA: OmpA family protein [Gemmatimonadales bacterium]|nr:OmpA family protein [Gemmatimonadales bacterium]
MRSLFAFLFAVTFLAPRNSAAQSGSAVAPAGADTIAAAAAAVIKKKKGGMFGKFKGLAKNKVVKTVAKTALCTVVPGGQVVAGALEAAETKNVAGAAGAAGAALSGGGGGGCMPGMPGMAAPTSPAAGGVGAAGVGALGAAASAAALPGQPSTGMPGMAMSPEQLKQMQEQYGKMGMDTAQLRAMQQMMAGLPGASQGEAAAPSGPAAVAGGPALTREKGKMLLRRLPWVPGSDAVQQGTEPMFGMVMQEVAAAIKAAPKRYKIEARVEEQGGKAQNRLLSQKRGAAVLAALTARGVPADALTVSEGKADKDPRIIVSEGK